MKKIQRILALAFILSGAALFATAPASVTIREMEMPSDSLQLAELDTFWAEVSRTVEEGDFEGYGATYHKDAVVVFTTGGRKTSMTIAKALLNWKQGFEDTKAGKTQNKVEFRFSERINDETTAHETGIFAFQSNHGSAQENPKQFVHFDALLIKKDGAWLMLMEYQKSSATSEEWELLE
ncbi:hypothetical protein [Maribacter sp. 2307ULW6-5]|uniref:hypothetical protein n=1 Tax=Maribacter sp. 2307ULW6-5 TaxID=3386275 RepID=UPI0039BC478B